MLVAVDVGYHGNFARAAAVVFADWKSESVLEAFIVDVPDVAEYVPGQFYKRELPCILQVLACVTQLIDLVIIDGYVTLGDADQPGLGLHLWNALKQQVSIIGVAKSAFGILTEEKKIYRGNSSRPLFISAVGIPLSLAKDHISQMAGKHRLPKLLKEVDALTRKPQ